MATGKEEEEERRLFNLRNYLPLFFSTIYTREQDSGNHYYG